MKPQEELATNGDIPQLRGDIALLRGDMTRLATKEDLLQLRADLFRALWIQTVVNVVMFTVFLFLIR